MIPGYGGALREVEAGPQRRGGTSNGKNSQVLTGTWDQAESGKGGEGSQSQEMATDAGTWRGAQRQAAEAGG